MVQPPAIWLLVLVCAGSVAVGHPDQHATSAGKSWPKSWFSISALDEFYESATGRPRRSKAENRWVGGFGWFVYTTVFDPGLVNKDGMRGYVADPMGEAAHREFALLAADVKSNERLQNALITLYDHADYLGTLRGEVGGWFHRPKVVGGLVMPHMREDHESAMGTVARDMKDLADSREAPQRVRAIAQLLYALATRADGDRSAAIAVLEEIPERYPEQKTTVLASRHYLWKQLWRPKDDRPAQVAKEAVEAHACDTWLHDLHTYKFLLKMAREHDARSGT